MIFNKLNILVVIAALAFGFSLNALAADSGNHCIMGCSSAPASPGSSLNVTGSARTGGDSNSIYFGDSGSNEVNRFGETKTVVESSLGGFCTEGVCSDTSVNIDLMASEGGNALTTVGSDTSGVEISAENSGAFMSGASGGIKDNSNTTQFASHGASAFANQAKSKATGGNVNSTMETFGSGQTVSTLGTDGNVCPNCGAIKGGTTSNAASGMNFMSRATGNRSGQAVSITSATMTEAATSMSNMFKQGNQ